MIPRGFAAGFLLTGAALAASATAKTDAAVARVDFERDVRPIVSRCAPCHFEGGSVYARMPFDKPETITRLGVRLFTRIKDEKEQAVIRRFLEQNK